ncbi:hypothetical protein BDQ17DRAFT_160727 [Cyathus striatus]|nr:hypothetical protein BDQ17DRAFT_160727 [Cyathus striatus]
MTFESTKPKLTRPRVSKYTADAEKMCESRAYITKSHKLLINEVFTILTELAGLKYNGPQSYMFFGSTYNEVLAAMEHFNKFAAEVEALTRNYHAESELAVYETQKASSVNTAKIVSTILFHNFPSKVRVKE